MDWFPYPKAQIVIEIKEGNGFTFLTNPLIIIGTLNGVQLETKEVLPSSCPLFDSELVWQSDSKFLRKLRISNTALKLECFTFKNYNKQNERRDRIGYLLINLKEAQVVSNNDNVIIPSSWHRLLGLKNLSQAHKPELLLKFKIEEVSETKSSYEVDNSKNVKLNTSFIMEGHCSMGMIPNQISEPFQIGPPHLCTELYELSINVVSGGHMSKIIPKEMVDIPIKAHFIMFGYSFFIKDLSVFREKMNYGRISLKIWSQLHYITAYFKEFPTLMLSIYRGGDIVGTGLMDLQVLGNLTTKRNITINQTVPVNSASEGEENLGSGSDYPFLEMEVLLLHQKDSFSTKIDQETQSNDEYIDRFESGDNPYVSKCIRCIESSSTKEIGMVIEKNANPNDIHLRGESKPTYNHNMNSDELPELLTTSPGSPNIDPINPHNKIENSKKTVRSATFRVCEELEDWKEKQQEIFKFELKKKTDRHLKKLSNEWLKKKYELEDDLKKRIDECHLLKEKLINALEDLTNRSEQLAKKEEELKIAKEELDKKYTVKFQELRKASKLHEYDMEDKIHEITSEKADLYKKLEDSRKEILRLQDALLNQEVPNQLSKEQSANLISEIRNLEQKLEKAVESKIFFKEQWGKAVRELHRMKKEEQEHLKLQIQKNRQELQTLGLVQEMSQEVSEMKKDQSTIKNIRNELANFITAKNEPFMGCIQNTC